MQLAVHHGAARLDIGDVEEMVVRAARETDAQPLAHGGMRAVAAGDIKSLARVGAAIGAFEPGAHACRRLLEPDELRLALDLDAGFRKAIDQQAFVLVLRIDQRIGKRTDIRAHVAEDHARDMFAAPPEIDGGHLPAALDHRVGETDLLVQLQRSCLDGERTRRRAGLRGLVDDPDADAQSIQPQRQHQARRAGPDDEDVSVIGQRGIVSRIAAWLDPDARSKLTETARSSRAGIEVLSSQLSALSSQF